jgi:hypothetical protein
MSGRSWVITYEGHDLHLSEGEYTQLHQATYNDPVAAERLALMHLARERLDAALAELARIDRDNCGCVSVTIP